MNNRANITFVNTYSHILYGYFTWRVSYCEELVGVTTQGDEYVAH